MVIGSFFLWSVCRVLIVTLLLWFAGAEPMGEWDDCRIWHDENATGRTEETWEVDFDDRSALCRVLDGARR